MSIDYTDVCRWWHAWGGSWRVVWGTSVILEVKRH